MKLKGRVWKFGDEIDTDVIIPAKYCVLTPDEYKKHIMEATRPDFYSLVEEGDFIFAGRGFGLGSSRGHAVIALVEAGIRAIVAKSFARIFYRSSINEGLPVIECFEAYEKTEEGDFVEIDISAGFITNENKGLKFNFKPFPDLVSEIINAGSGILYYKNKLQSTGNE